MDAFIISPNKDRVDKWKADDPPEPEPSDSTKPTSNNSFAELANSFEKAIDSFQNTVPFIMQMVPLLLQISDDHSIRGFTKKHGVSLEEEERLFETYSLCIEHIGELTRRIEKRISIRSGVAALPSMFSRGIGKRLRQVPVRLDSRDIHDGPRVAIFIGAEPFI